MMTGPGRRLLGRIGPTRRWVAIDSALGIVTIGSGIGLIAMAIALLTRSAIFGATVSLSLAILGVRFFAVLRVVGRYCERYIGHLGTFRILTRLRVWLFAQLVADDALSVADRRRGDVVTGLVDDIETMQDRLLRVASPPFVALGTLAISTVALVLIDVRAATILAGTFLVAALAMPPIIHARMSTAAESLVELRAERLGRATELLEARETLAVWGRSELPIEVLGRLDDREEPIGRRLSTTRAVLDGAIIALIGFCVIAIVAVITSAGERTSTIWWFAAAPLIALATFEALGPLLSRPEHRARTDRAAARVLRLAGDERTSTGQHNIADIPPSPPPARPRVELDAVSFSYPNGDPVLIDTSLSLPFGSTVAIAAPSGAGKSTIVDLLVGLLRPTSGAVTIGGVRPDSRTDFSRPIVVAVMQHDHLFDTSIRDNLLLGNGDATDEQVVQACAVAGLGPFLRQRKDGLDAPIGPNGSMLSGGERQRLMIARALVADAPVLVLDEATEHLEPALRADVLRAIARARRGLTTIFLGHDRAELDAVGLDLVIQLTGGRLEPRP